MKKLFLVISLMVVAFFSSFGEVRVLSSEELEKIKTPDFDVSFCVLATSYDELETFQIEEMIKGKKTTALLMPMECGNELSEIGVNYMFGCFQKFDLFSFSNSICYFLFEIISDEACKITIYE